MHHRQPNPAARLPVLEKAFVKIKTEGDSMRPLIRGGEMVEAAPFCSGSVRSGDCVVYQWEDRTLLHRVWWKSKNCFFIKDDAALMRIHPVLSNQILFKVISKGILSKGLIGLCYSILINGVFLSGRLARRLLFLTPKKNTAPSLTSAKTPL